VSLNILICVLRQPTFSTQPVRCFRVGQNDSFESFFRRHIDARNIDARAEVRESILQSGFRIFIEDALVEPLDGRTLDVSEGEGGPELIFR
jgi:hypothetical protein